MFCSVLFLGKTVYDLTVPISVFHLLYTRCERDGNDIKVVICSVSWCLSNTSHLIIEYLIDWLVDWLFSWLISQPVNHLNIYLNCYNCHWLPVILHPWLFSCPGMMAKMSNWIQGKRMDRQIILRNTSELSHVSQQNTVSIYWPNVCQGYQGCP